MPTSSGMIVFLSQTIKNECKALFLVEEQFLHLKIPEKVFSDIFVSTDVCEIQLMNFERLCCDIASMGINEG